MPPEDKLMLILTVIIGGVIMWGAMVLLTGCSSDPRAYPPPQIAPCADGHIPTMQRPCK